MQSKATTVAAYLAALPADRRATLEAVRTAILKGLDAGYEEGMQYGMIGYYVPHSIFPAGYHCDPKQPLPFAGLASQKGHMSVYMMGLYIGADGVETPLTKWFREAWTKTGRKLDMGKACVRFKKLEDVPLDVVTEVVRRMSVKKYVEQYTKALAMTASRGKAAAPKKPTPKAGAAKPSAKKAAPKRAKSI
ncbi:MAG: DUF1801 domain-containing protein [Planctomycetota bacterium]|nr:DUF1801 domain-containing protein [Planctomycetota bacterium]